MLSVITLSAFTIIMLSSMTHSYDILNYQATIVNPVQSHEIPMDIYYPKTTNNEQFPILVFGHCLFGPPNYYDFIWKALVPIGYTVILPIGDRFSGSEELLASDMRYSLDWVIDNCTQCPQTLTKLVANGDNKVAAAGHSEGAGSAVWVLSDVPLEKGQEFNHSFDAAITLSVCGETGTLTSAKNITKPIMLLDGSSDCMCAPEDHSDIYYEIIANSTFCKYETIITNATHCNFADLAIPDDEACLALENAACPSKETDLKCKVQNQITVDYMTLFLNATLIYYNQNDAFKKLNDQIQTDMNDGVLYSSRSHSCN